MLKVIKGYCVHQTPSIITRIKKRTGYACHTSVLVPYPLRAGEMSAQGAVIISTSEHSGPEISVSHIYFQTDSKQNRYATANIVSMYFYSSAAAADRRKKSEWPLKNDHYHYKYNLDCRFSQ